MHLPKFLKSLLIGSLSLQSLANIHAQPKLPNIQTKSIRTPADLKIDGKSLEWNDQFQAYNRATSVFYTMANNDDVLYLIIKASDPDVINKIVDRGVTLTIKRSKKDKDNMSFMYPVTYGKSIVSFR